MKADHREGGFATLSYVGAAALALYFFAVLANLIVAQYAVGVARAAVDEGARSGAVGGAVECARRAGETLEVLLGGPYGDGVTVSCVEEGGWVRAEAEVALPGLVPPVPDMRLRLEGAAAREGT